MTYVANLWIYTLLLFSIILVPGMDMLFVLANSLSKGVRSGLSATGGIMLGGALHSLFGALLVIVFLQVPPSWFSPLVVAGSLYMGWIGYSLLSSTLRIDANAGQAAQSIWIAFRQGTVTYLLNPKAWLFVLAVYPQFLKPVYGNIWLQALLMGLLTVLIQAAVYGSVALLAGRTRRFLAQNPMVIILATRVIGAFFLIIAALTVFRAVL